MTMLTLPLHKMTELLLSPTSKQCHMSKMTPTTKRKTALTKKERNNKTRTMLHFLPDEGDGEDPPFNEGYDKNEGISYNFDDNDAADDSNNAGISFSDSEGGITKKKARPVKMTSMRLACSLLHCMSTSSLLKL
jgi:hypothetical protein